MGGYEVFCICNEEWCFCSNWILLDDVDPRAHRYPPPEIACDECKKGSHVMEMGGSRAR